MMWFKKRQRQRNELQDLVTSLDILRTQLCELIDRQKELQTAQYSALVESAVALKNAFKTPEDK